LTEPHEDLEIQRVDGSVPEWDRFVTAAEGSTFCHLGGWDSIMRGVLKHEPIYLAAMDARGTWRGVLPLVRVKSVLGHYIISLPFLNDGGPLGDTNAKRALIDFAVAEAQRSGAGLLELRARTELPGAVVPTNRKITVMLPLPDSIEALWEKTFKAKLRSQVRRPAKEGMVARCGADELSAFYEVFARNMRDLGTPVLPRAFFERIQAAFGDRVVFTAVRSAEGQTAAAGCSFIWNGEVEIVWASSLREFNKFSPNMLLYSTLMEESIRRGVGTFNFGRCTAGGPTHKFKLQWGGHDVPLPWPSWSRSGHVGTPSPEKPIFQIATAVWSRLPMAVANRIGPILARQLP
jgi:serine/alanine adding enzyme